MVGGVSNYQPPQLNKTPSQASSSNDLKSSRNLVSKCSTLKCQFSSPASKCSSTSNLPVVTPSPTSKTMPYSTPISSISERISCASKFFDAKLKEFEIFEEDSHLDLSSISKGLDDDSSVDSDSSDDLSLNEWVENLG